MILKEDFPVAKTQMFILKDEPKDIIAKIISSLEFDISYSSVNIDNALKGSEKFEKMHSDIKEIIKTKTGAKDSPKYSILKTKDKCYFFFISKEKTVDFDFLRILSDKRVNFNDLVKSLIELTFKNRIINSLEENYNIPSSILNDKMYLGCIPQSKNIKKNGGIYIDTFEPNFYFCENTKRLSFQMISKTFSSKVEKDEIVLSDDDKSAWFKTELGNIKIKEQKINAVSFNKTKFMLYKEDYINSKNYFQNLTYSYLESMLKSLNLDFESVNFKANGYKSNFLTFETNIDKELIVVDNYNYKEKEQEYKENFLFKFNGISKNKKIVNGKDFKIEDLSEENIYLFINNLLNNEKSTIKYFENEDNNKTYNLFLNAYKDKDKNLNNFDIYTKVKKINFDRKEKFITQGVNIEKIDKKGINDSIINKLKIELWLKNKIFRDKKIENVELEDSDFIFFYYKSIKIGKEKVKFIVELDLKIENKILKIGECKIYEDVKEFNFKNRKSFVSKIDITKNSDSFYIYDKKNKILMTSYSSVNIPQIIGSDSINSLEYFQENGIMTRSNGYNSTILPYYISKVIEPKKRMYVYIQENEKDLYYFVSKQQSPNSSFDKQNKVYCIKTWDENGKETISNKEHVTSVFLSSFTFNILNINESSKSSLLEKIAKEMLFI